MINRRSLRIKAFKNLYSYESCKGANYLMGLDMIDKEFSPDLNSMEIVDKADLDRKKELAIEDFSKYFDRTEESKEQNAEVAGEVNEACEFVEKQIEEVGKKAKKHDCTKKEILLLFQEWDLILFSVHSSQNIIPISLWSSLAD